jgi:hypothetical protein
MPPVLTPPAYGGFGFSLFQVDTGSSDIWAITDECQRVSVSPAPSPEAGTCWPVTECVLVGLMRAWCFAAHCEGGAVRLPSRCKLRGW